MAQNPDKLFSVSNCHFDFVLCDATVIQSLVSSNFCLTFHACPCIQWPGRAAPFCSALSQAMDLWSEVVSFVMRDSKRSTLGIRI